MDVDDDERARLLAFQTLLDASRDASESRVEMTALRKLCARGIPEHPKHLRPLAYSLLLETLPPEKKMWKQASRQQRQRYYGLVKVFMDELENAPTPSDPPSTSDSLLRSISSDIERLHSRIPFLRMRSAPSRRSPLSPPSAEDPLGFKPDIEVGPGRSGSPADDSSSSSSGDEKEVSKRVEDRHERSAARTRKRQEVERILSRRAATQRIGLVAEAAHMRQYESRPETAGSRSDPMINRKGKGKETDFEGIPMVSSPETNLSPRITLSPEPEDHSSFPSIANGTGSSITARLESIRSLSHKTPHLSLSLPTAQPSSSDQGKPHPPSPITLLSPKPIPTPGSLPFSSSSSPSSPVSGSILQPDTHVEILTRLLYVFCRAHPQWCYAPGFVDIIIPIYLLYAGGDMAPSPRSKQARKAAIEKTALTLRPGSKYAEEETFWAFAGLMSDFGDLVSSGQSNQSRNVETKDVEWALIRLGRRVRWADAELWSVLKQRNLDPSSPLYAYRWITLLLTQDISHSSIHPLWDFLFSEPPSTSAQQPKVDLLIDVCAALLLLCKERLIRPPPASSPRRSKPKSPKRGLWGELSSDEESVHASPSAEDPQDAFVRGLQLLRSYPLHEVGGIEAVLQTAFELRQARVVAGLSGDDPDAPGWEEARDAETKPSWTSEKFRQAASGASKKLWSGTSEGSTSMSTISSSGSKLFSKYAETVQQSDAAASLAKASTNWTASAMARWADASKVAANLPATARAQAGAKGPDWSGLGATAGKLWSSVRKPTASEGSFDGSDDDDKFTSMPGTPSKRDSKTRESILPPKFVSPKSTIRYSAGQVPASIAARRERSDSTTSGISVTSLQDRLASLASSLTGASPTTVMSLSSSQVSGPPKPLLLSGSARRASNSSQGISGRYTRGTSPSPALSSPAANGTLSPPSMAPIRSYESDGTTSGGLYRIGSRNSIGRSPRTPTANGVIEGGSGRKMSEGDISIHAAASRLREATSVGENGNSLPRSPGRHAGLSQQTGANGLRRSRQNTVSSLGSDSDLGSTVMSPISTMESSGPSVPGRKWSLTDPGTGTNSPEDSDNPSSSAAYRKYSLTDDGNKPLTRRNSSDSQSNSSILPLGRTRVVKKKFQKRPTSLRLASQDSSSFPSIPSPIHEPEKESETEVQHQPKLVEMVKKVEQPISIPTPQIGHLTEEDYEHVYEPAEDSFILLDALEADALALRELKPSLCVEIGSGSGIASAFLATLLGPGNAALISTDINRYACDATLRTGKANDVQLNPVLGYLLDPLVERIRNKVDVLIFNPPYVPTDESEITITQRSRGIGGAWAGGDDGMSVTNILLEQVAALLAPNGRFYLVAVQQNKPDEINAKMTSLGLQCKTILKRRAGRELLSVIRMIKPPPVTVVSSIQPRTRLLGPRSRPSQSTTTTTTFTQKLSIPSPVLEQGGTFSSQPDGLSKSPKPFSSLVNGNANGGGEEGNTKGHRVRYSVDEMADDEDDDEGYGGLLDAYKS